MSGQEEEQESVSLQQQQQRQNPEGQPGNVKGSATWLPKDDSSEGDDDTVKGESDNDVEEGEESSPMLPPTVTTAADAIDQYASATTVGNNGRQDYRLDFTEVEGTLEAVPEELPAVCKQSGSSDVSATVTSGGGSGGIGVCGGIGVGAGVGVGVGVSSSGGGLEILSGTDSAAPTASYSAPTAVTVGGTSVPSATQSSSWQQPPLESNASDVAFSEYSADYYGRPSVSASWFVRSSEPLTAKQQVALWLTRTSMSDVSSMASLRSLVFPKSRHSSQYNNPRVSSYSSSSRTSRRHSKPRHHHHQMPRNFSTKSLVSRAPPALDDDDDVCGIGDGNGDRCIGRLTTSPAALRKAETVQTLSDLSRSFNGGGSRSKRSSLNIFKRLSRRGGNCGSEHSAGGRNPRLFPRATFSINSDANGGESGCESPFRQPGLRPVNRLRSSSSQLCSRCASVISYNNSRMTSRATSQMSLFQMSVNFRKMSSSAAMFDPETPQCKICLMDTPLREMAKLQECGCTFCKECMLQYLTFEVMAGAYDISCPDPACDKQGVLQLTEIENMAGKDVADKHKAFRLNTEVALDSSRTWCPAPDCGTICHICKPDRGNEGDAEEDDSGGCFNNPDAVSVECPSCQKQFCSLCSANAHPGKTCAQNGQELVQRNLSSAGGTYAQQQVDDLLFNYDRFGGDIKPCPMCRVPIERDAGCAQMMCKRCKHVFCWYCLTSLDDDFLLRHYDSGACQGKLGHSRISVLFHRAQVIGIFAGFGILLLVASPVLLLAAPCVLCCRCKILDKLDPEGAVGRSRSSSSGGDNSTAGGGVSASSSK